MTKIPRASRLDRTFGLVAVVCALLIAGRGVLSAQGVYLTPYSISTLEGGTGTFRGIYGPEGLALDSSGNLYVAGQVSCVIFKITPAGAMSVLAGGVMEPFGVPPHAGADGVGPAAIFADPTGIAVDGSGNVYVADTVDCTIRRITPAGVVTTLAGAALIQGSADGSGSAARFAYPSGVAVDVSGNVYVADSGNSTIRKLTPAGVVTTLAGAAGSTGNGDGIGVAARFNYPWGIALDGSGSLYVTDTENSTVRKITPAGVVTTLAGSPGAPGSADGIGSAARFNLPEGLVVDGSGNVFVADMGNSTIRKITPAGVVTTLAGLAGDPSIADGTGSNARLGYPGGLAADSSGRIFFTDGSDDTIRMGVPYSDFITAGPVSQTIDAGSTVVFNCQVVGTSLPTLKWSFDAAPLTDGTSGPTGISGSTAPILVISGPTSVNAGSYTCTVTNSEGTVTSLPATLTVNALPVDPGRLINLSCRSSVGAGGNILIAGFVVGGGDTPGSEYLLVRASGPALAPFGVTGILPDPNLNIVNSSSNGVIATNNSWGGASLLTSIAIDVGAFPWTDPSSHDSALVDTFPAGAYTALVWGAGGDSGIALVEIYEVPRAVPQYLPYPTSTTRLINLSARTLVGQGGNALIAGFVIGGTSSRTVLIRASGPALASFGLPGVLPDPYLRLSNSGGVFATNEGWGGNAQIAAVAASQGAFSWGLSATADSALLVTLPPGAYTAVVSGAAGTAGDVGVGLVEVYEVP